MTFDNAVVIVIENEGGFVDDPADKGGATKYGISKSSYPDLDIASLTLEDAKAIYKRDYWDKCRCGELPNGVDLMTFDAAVNQGPNAAIKQLQRSVGVKDDGVIGSVTLAAVNTHSVDMLLIEQSSQRMNTYGLNPQFTRYGLGWSRRLMETFAQCL